MKHNLTISVSKATANPGVVSYRCINIRERLLRLLLGKKQRLTILVPGDSVESLAIKEIQEEGGNQHGYLDPDAYQSTTL